METNAYYANCHCGANRLLVSSRGLQPAFSCNCSLCSKKGYLWLNLGDKGFEITRGGPDSLTTYKSAALEHRFCAHCGTGLWGVHAVGPLAGQKLVNVGSFMDVDPFQVEVTESNGRQDESPAFAPRAFPGEIPQLTEDCLETYIGGCHCGAVGLALLSKPLPEIEVNQDNCSICMRISGVNVYPDKSQVAITGRENTTDYRYGQKFSGAPFCKTCGVHCFKNLYGPPQEVVDRLPESKREFVLRQLRIQPVNLRVLEGVEWDKITVKREDEGTKGYILD